MAEIMERFVPLFAKAFPLLEPFMPRYITRNVKRRLKNLKERGVILDYKAKTRRLGKLHYKIAVDVDLTQQQAAVIMKELSDEAGRTVVKSLMEVMLWLKRRKVT
jgi:DNA-binding Lrp family transcriptional regulator